MILIKTYYLLELETFIYVIIFYTDNDILKFNVFNIS